MKLCLSQLFPGAADGHFLALARMARHEPLHATRLRQKGVAAGKEVEANLSTPSWARLGALVVARQHPESMASRLDRLAALRARHAS